MEIIKEMEYRELGKMARDFCLGYDLLIFADLQPKFAMLTHQVLNPIKHKKDSSNNDSFIDEIKNYF